MTGEQSTTVDVLVVTALQLERLAVREYLSDVEVLEASGLYADVGSFSAPSGSLRVAAIETGAGNVGAAVLTARAEEQMRPAVIAMAGVAGGLKDVAVGDVVASSKVYWLEGGKHEVQVKPRPEFAPVSSSLVQLARAAAANDKWRTLAAGHGGGDWAGAGRPSRALVAPIVTGEKVLADNRAAVVQQAREVYGDAVAVDMEDFGTLRGGNSTERARVVAVRGISDLVDNKARSDAAGSQPHAAANAAAFLFTMLSTLASPHRPTRTRDRAIPDLAAIASIGAELYPEGPQQHGLWRRAGGDESRLSPSGPGFARWWEAAVLLDHGGGGTNITLQSLLVTMRGDYPNSEALRTVSAAAGTVMTETDR